MLFFGSKKEIKPEIFTEETCQACGEKARRTFEDGDYVYRPGRHACAKCSSASTLVTAVYGEYPPDEQQRKNERDKAAY